MLTTVKNTSTVDQKSNGPNHRKPELDILADQKDSHEFSENELFDNNLDYSFNSSSPVDTHNHFIQPKLQINNPGDIYEQEADRIADQVVSISERKSLDQSDEISLQRKPLADEVSSINISTQRKCAKCEEEEENYIQRRTSVNATNDLSEDLVSHLHRTKGKGRQMDTRTSAYMSSRFGVDFSHVRIHNDHTAGRMSQGINAQAFTNGKDIYFNTDSYNPQSIEGKKLLAHELVHTLQQGKSDFKRNAGPDVQRKGGTFFGFFRNFGRAIASIFGDELGYDDETIETYLEVLRAGDIEDDYDSDDKARAVVRRWKAGNLILATDIKILLIREMITGFTGDADETAILDLLRGSTKELQRIYDGVSQAEIRKEFHGSELDDLNDFFESGGGERLEDCDESETATINNATTTAASMLDRAITVLQEDASEDLVNDALWMMFRSSSPETRQLVLSRLQDIRAQFSNVQYSCIDETDRSDCAYFSAFVQNHENPVYLCTNKMSDYSTTEAYGELIIHEASHLFFGSVVDHGYFTESCQETLESEVLLNGNPNPVRERATEGDPPSERINNADSYSCLVYVLADSRRSSESETDRQAYDTEIGTLAESYRAIGLRIVRSESLTESISGNTIYLYPDMFSEINEYEFELENDPEGSGFTYEWRLYKGANDDNPVILESSSGEVSLRDQIDMLRSENVTEGTLECRVRHRSHRGAENQTERIRRHYRFNHSGRPNNASQNIFQPKLKINSPGDPYEREADRIADQVVNMSGIDAIQYSGGKNIQRKSLIDEISRVGISTQRKCAACEEEEEVLQRKQAGFSATVANSNLISKLQKTNGHGQRMDSATNAYMSSRFGVHFSRVRIHKDDQAASMSQQIQAKAFTRGNDIYFNKGAYDPQTTAGKKLLAHELTHVVQQRGGSMNSVQRKKTKKAKTLWYQDAINEYKTASNYIVPIHSVALVRIVLELALAIDKEAKSDITAMLKKLIAGDADKLPLVHPSGRLVERMHSRLLMLNMTSEARSLRNWHVTVNMVRWESPKSGRREYTTEFWFFDNALEMAQAAIKPKDPASSLRGLKGAATAIGEMRNEAFGLDQKKLKEDRKDRSEFFASAGSMAWGIWGKTISVYEDNLAEFIKRGFEIAMEAWEVILQHAITDLQKGNGVTWLNALETQGKVLQRIVFPKNTKHRLGGLEVESTRSEFGEKKGKHLDRFLKGRAAKRRSVGIGYYEREFGGILAEEKNVTFWRALTVRNQQLQFLRRLYGLEKKGGNVTAESKENKAAIQSGLHGKMRLHSNKDWRTFALAKFNVAKLRLGDDAKALRSLIQLLQQYMAAFTSHSPYNIDDFGSNYLSKSFPRDLTGRLIHDCGVYALRVAFILSLIRRQLKLRFRFVALPLHVGLVITGPGMPLWVLHNNNFIELTPSELANAQKKWRETTAQGAQRPAVPLNEPQFVGEIAARFFVPGTDTPFKLLDVPKPSKSGSNDEKSLWRFYTGKFAKAQLFSKTIHKPGHPNYQFDLHYLEILKLAKVWHNAHLVRFWNVTAPDLWKKNSPAIRTAHTALVKNPGDAELRKAYKKEVKTYIQTLEVAFNTITKKRGDIVAKQVEVSVELQKLAKTKPSILTKGTHIQPSERFGSGHWVSDRILQHILDLKKPTPNITPPFMGKGNKVWPMD